MVEKANILKGSGNTPGRDLMTLEAFDTFVPEDNLPAIGPTHAGQNIKQRRLAGPIRSYQAGDHSFLNVQVNPIERPDPPEVLGQGFDL